MTDEEIGEQLSSAEVGKGELDTLRVLRKLVHAQIVKLT